MERGAVGRPPIEPSERRRNRLPINLTDAEYDALVEAAGEELPSTFARQIVVRYLERRQRR